LPSRNNSYDKETQSATSVPASPDADRAHRMKVYTIAMLIRTACVVLIVLVEGWWIWLFAVGAIFLPYFAVVIANNQENKPNDSRSLLPVSLGLKSDSTT
jgi:predicted cobalt transporter CbtA